LQKRGTCLLTFDVVTG